MFPLGKQFDSSTTSVLLADDDPGECQAHAEALQQQGYRVLTATDGSDALALLAERAFDCVVAGLARPELDAIRLLRTIRERNLDLPVIVETVHPTVESAAEAVEWDAFRYLIKPVPASHLVELVGLAARAHRVARLRRAAWAYLEQIGFRDRAGEFEAAFGQIWMAFQPIVRWPQRRVVGYEALVRSRSPVYSHPGALLDAAAQLGRLRDLGQSIRKAVAEVVGTADEQATFFVNVQAQDLLDSDLYATSCPLAAVAQRVVLEITERESLEHIDGLSDRIARLRDLGYRIAVDDVGAGYADLSWLAPLKPDVIKLDMAVTRDIHVDPATRSLVASLTRLCRELDVAVVAEGVESELQRDGLATAGCDLFQGFLFGRPEPRLLDGMPAW